QGDELAPPEAKRPHHQHHTAQARIRFGTRQAPLQLLDGERGRRPEEAAQQTRRRAARAPEGQLPLELEADEIDAPAPERPKKGVAQEPRPVDEQVAQESPEDSHRMTRASERGARWSGSCL